MVRTTAPEPFVNGETAGSHTVRICETHCLHVIWKIVCWKTTNGPLGVNPQAMRSNVPAGGARPQSRAGTVVASTAITAELWVIASSTSASLLPTVM